MQAQFGIHLTQKKIKSIEQVQKRASRIVHNNYTDRIPGCVTNMVKSLKWENLEDRRKSARLSMLFKIQHDLIDIDRQQYLMPNDSQIRGKNRFYQKRSSMDTYGQSFFPKTIRDWNQFPTNTTSADTIEGFRAALKSSTGRK
jgi:hypothetical protein